MRERHERRMDARRRRAPLAAALAICCGLLAGGGAQAGPPPDHRAPAATPAAGAAATAGARAGAAASSDEVAFDATHTDIGNVGLAITNFGFFGNNFNDRSPSFEYPLGGEVEHMVRGGVWVGAIRADTGDTLVSSGTTDGRVGDDTDAATEWTPTRPITRRSVLINDRFYSPDAISEQDFITAYADTVPIDRPNAEDHRPLGVEVHQRVLGWSYDPANGFIIVEVEVVNINHGVDLLDLHIGMYSELASGFKGAYEDWPPGGAWFQQKELDFDPERWMVLEHHTTYDVGNAPQLGCLALIGTRPDSLALMRPSFRWWAWDPGNEQRDQDIERYAVLAQPGFDDVTTIRLEDDPAELIGVGPWPLVAPGDTVAAVFAFIGGNDGTDALAKADWAREAFRRNYVVPLPPPSPRLYVDPRPAGVTVRWDLSPEGVVDPSTGIADFEGYRIYLSRGEIDQSGVIWYQLGELDLVDGIGFDTGLSHLQETFTDPNGTVFHYRFDIESLKDGHKYWLAVTAYDTGDPETASLESGVSQNRAAIITGSDPNDADVRPVTVFPNPYNGRASWDGQRERERVLWFGNLPARAEIRIYTLGGDWVDSIDFDAERYHGANAAGVYDPGSTDDRPELSGGLAAWDLLSWNNQPVASGLYLYIVRDLVTGRTQHGRFMVLK